MTYTELFRALAHARRALQGLAALTGDDACVEHACFLDALASYVRRATLHG